jgi:phage terminase large subunit-like protein
MRLLISRTLQHGGNPVAAWCASNVSVRRDPAGNEKPDKEKSTERIDAIVAAIMAVGRLQTAQGGSVYEERGLLVF